MGISYLFSFIVSFVLPAAAMPPDVSLSILNSDTIRLGKAFFGFHCHFFDYICYVFIHKYYILVYNQSVIIFNKNSTFRKALTARIPTDESLPFIFVLLHATLVILSPARRLFAYLLQQQSE